ncbi:MAG: hypothetical protein GVY29_01095 [Spirochaetes bacterium]|jgi:hypothetical protein|nr:hypothetical protein [Spirochaetota bacterium]
MMNRIAKVLAAAMLVAIVFSGCNLIGGLVGRGDTVEGVKDALVQFPESLTKSSTSSQMQSLASVVPQATDAEVIDYVGYVYAPVREHYNPIAQGAIDFTVEMLTAVEDNILSNGVIMNRLDNQGEVSGYEDGETSAYRVTKPAADTYTVELWAQSDGAWQKNIDLTIEPSGDGWKGTIIARNTDDPAKNTLYQVDFDENDADFGKVTELRAVDLEVYDADDPERDENVPTKLWIQAFEKDDTFSVNAAVNYTHVDIEDSSDFGDLFLAEIDGGETTEDGIVASYIYQGVASLTEDQGAVSLALVPGNVDDNSTIFDTYAYGEIYKRAIGNWVRTNPELEPGVSLIPAINAYLDLAGNPVADISDSSTDDEVFAALEAIRDWADAQGEDTSDLDAILFVVEVVNPGYYTSTGFVGTAQLATPDWAADLADSQDDFTGSVEVTAAGIAADDFTVTMPEPVAPNF